MEAVAQIEEGKTAMIHKSLTQGSEITCPSIIKST